MRAAALGSGTARLSSSPSWIHAYREKKERSTRDSADFPRSRVIHFQSREITGENQSAPSPSRLPSHRGREGSRVLSSECPYQRGRKRDREGEKCTAAQRRDFAEPNEMLSGIWEVLAARSHLYATPPPQLVRPPRHWLSSRFSLAIVVVVGIPRLDPAIFALQQCLPSSIFLGPLTH